MRIALAVAVIWWRAERLGRCARFAAGGGNERRRQSVERLEPAAGDLARDELLRGGVAERRGREVELAAVDMVEDEEAAGKRRRTVGAAHQAIRRGVKRGVLAERAMGDGGEQEGGTPLAIGFRGLVQVGGEHRSRLGGPLSKECVERDPEARVAARCGRGVAADRRAQ